MSYPVVTEEIYIPAQLYDNDVKKLKVQYPETTAIDDEEKLNASKGIVSALIISTPIWLLILAGIVWLI